MPGLITPDERFRDDDGSADPLLAAALADYAAGRASEHAALVALAHTRLLVPVTAVVPQPGTSGGTEGAAKASEMALPLLTGRDGRPAIPAFTSLDTLRRWRPDARPLPAATASVCRAVIADGVPAVVVDVAGPVPVVLEGARLADLAAGREPVQPADDPDVQAAVAAAVAAEPDVVAVSLLPGGTDTDLTVHLALAHAVEAVPAARRAAHAIMSAFAGRFRRGIEVKVMPHEPAGRA